jgi:hypothetical protein
MRIIISVVLLFSISALAQTNSDRPNPFGFRPGMTEAEIVSAVGKSAIEIKTENPEMMILKTAPKPNDEFSRYTVIISSSRGLGKVLASSSVDSNRSGEQVRDKFKTIKAALIAKYGPPSDDYDFVHQGALWAEDNEFMKALAEGERTLACLWRLELTVLHQQRSTDIALAALGVDSNTASVILTYEFQPEFDAVKKERDAAKNGTY